MTHRPWTLLAALALTVGCTGGEVADKDDSDATTGSEGTEGTEDSGPEIDGTWTLDAVEAGGTNYEPEEIGGADEFTMIVVFEALAGEDTAEVSGTMESIAGSDVVAEVYEGTYQRGGEALTFEVSLIVTESTYNGTPQESGLVFDWDCVFTEEPEGLACMEADSIYLQKFVR